MDLNLLGKTAIVTCASRGIGKSISEHLLANGVKIAMISRNYNDLVRVKDSFNKNINQENIECFEADVSNHESIKNIVDKIYKKWNKIDILVNNAGITRDKILLRLSEEDWDQVININLKGYYIASKAVSKYMLKNKSGKIINIGSVIGQIGSSGQSNYAASKAGIEGLTRSLAVELGSRNINVNCIAPGYIETDMTKELNNDIVNKMKQNIPLNQLGSGEDIANLVCYLSSDLSSYITGQVINVDGGMTIK